MRKARIFLGWVIALLALPVFAGQFRAGAAKVEITPKVRTPLAGYGERESKMSRGVMDPIYSRALVIDDGNQRLAIVSDDLLLILADMKAAIAKNVSDLKLDGILLTATHTHSGPGGYSDIPAVKIAVLGKYVPAYREFLIAQISKAIREAAQNMKPARFGSSLAQAPGYAHNRRHEGAVDPSLGLIEITDLSGKAIAYVINYSEHPTVLPAANLKISGDYAGVLERTIEAKDPGSVALFENGSLGDQGPNCELEEEPVICMNRIGLGLAGEAWKYLQDVTATDQVKITIFDKMISMPKVAFRKGCWTGIGWLMKSMGKDLIRAEAEIMAVQINDTLIYGSGAELAAGVGKQLKALHPDKKEMVFSHSNDWLGYLLTPEQYDSGGYESCMSLYGKNFDPYLVEQFKELTADVK
jgi:hypothetical protein